ncbi:MAG: glycosyltransferase family 2 protein [Thermotogae bacterium]|nr:glycosyltransferase family 2 protein [Thermotogota bacterium]
MKDLSKRTAIIVLNWNKPEMTMECLESLQTMWGEYDIFVVDNGSDKDKKDKLIDEMKKRSAVILAEQTINDLTLDDRDGQLLLLILLDKNYGYAKGNNYGLRLAYRLGYKYSLISNNDVKIIDKNVLVELIKGIESDPKYAWAGPRIIGPDGREQKPRRRLNLSEYALERGILYPFLRKRGIEKNKAYENKNDFKYGWPVGCFIVIKSGIANEVNFFDEHTFLYAEELILSEKFLTKNYLFMYVETVSILHNHAQTTKYLFKNSSYKAEISRLNSDIYYFRRYRNYSAFACQLTRLSRIFYLLFYRPIVLSIKNRFNIGENNA